MKKMFFMLIALYGLCASACADKVNVDIAPPQTYDFQDSKIYNYSYDRVWDAVVKAVGSSYFVLENIEKDSGILSLSFSSQQPKNYIDCGHIREYGTIQMEKYELEYDGADSSVLRRVANPQGIPCTAHRALSLSGKSNILVSKISKNKTQVMIRTRYIAELLYTVNIYGHLPEVIKNTIVFTGKEVGNVGGNKNNMQCRSKGILESSIFESIEQRL